jgi:hypothetical protein
MDTQKMKVIVLKHGKAMVQELVVELGFPELEKIVADSPQKIDDLVLAAMEEPLKKAILDLLAKV